MKKALPKKPAKDQRERLVLLGLVELFLKTGKPIGSNTLRECGFKNLSSATIRNYFAKLEQGGYLKQHHASGGRVPTELAYKLYAKTFLSNYKLEDRDHQILSSVLQKETKEVALYLQSAIESISALTNCAAFISAPRFDQDFVSDVKLISIDSSRYLGVIITDFGLISSEILYGDRDIGLDSLKRMENYLLWRIRGVEKPSMNKDEEILAQRFYNELMLRRIVSYANFTHDDIFRTGFARLLSYPDFSDAAALASSLSIFENLEQLRNLSRECAVNGDLCCWIGDDLPIHNPGALCCSVISIPYKINQSIVGTISILGPHRLPYRRLFSILSEASQMISESLTKSLYKFKISYREPEAKTEKLPSSVVNHSKQLPHFLAEDLDIEP